MMARGRCRLIVAAGWMALLVPVVIGVGVLAK